jgi:hypothetical protein
MLTNHSVFLASFILILEAVTLSAQESNPTFRADQPILDLRTVDWQYVAKVQKDTPEEALKRADWAPIRVGESWDRVGHAELRPKVVWLRVCCSRGKSGTGCGLNRFALIRSLSPISPPLGSGGRDAGLTGGQAPVRSGHMRYASIVFPERKPGDHHDHRRRQPDPRPQGLRP